MRAYVFSFAWVTDRSPCQKRNCQHPGRRKTFFANRGMSSRLNGLVRLFAQRYLDPIPYDDDYCQQIQALDAEGDVVYVHRARNVVNHLALTRVVQGLELPKARFVGGLNVRWLRRWFGFFFESKITEGMSRRQRQARGVAPARVRPSRACGRALFTSSPHAGVRQGRV